MKKFLKGLTPIVIIDMLLMNVPLLVNEICSDKVNKHGLYGSILILWAFAQIFMHISVKYVVSWHILAAWICTFMMYDLRGRVLFAAISLIIAGAACFAFRKDRDEDLTFIFFIFLLFGGGMFVLLSQTEFDNVENLPLAVILLFAGAFRAIALLVTGKIILLIKGGMKRE